MDKIHIPSTELLAEQVPLRPLVLCPEITAHYSDDLYDLWKAWETETGGTREIPYWCVIWPGAAVMARQIMAGSVDVKGKSVLELGCGGAVAGIAAALSGAGEVVANDIDPVAIHLAKLNAAANQVDLVFDGRDLSLEGFPASAEVILVADMFYEKAPSERMVPLLTEARSRGVRVLLADGGRSFAPKEGIEVLAEQTVAVHDELEGRPERHVRLLEFTG
jgi:predicted nicotinamide N-methyase